MKNIVHHTCDDDGDGYDGVDDEGDDDDGGGDDDGEHEEQEECRSCR